MKINRILSTVAVGVVGVGLLPVLTATAAHADSTTQGDFESFVTGTPDGQNGWKVTNHSFDVAIVDPSDSWNGAFGSRALRMSNAVTSGGYIDQLFSQPTINEAGEASAQNGGVSGGTRQNEFSASFDFGSADPDHLQDGLALGISPDRGDGARMGLIRMYDKPEGLQVTIVAATNDGSDFPEVIVASGLDRTKKHHLSLVEHFVDGPSNDVFSVSVDTQAPVYGTSWEQYFREGEHNPTRTVDSLLFRSSIVASTPGALLGKGLLFDNMVTTTSTTSTLGACPVSNNPATKTVALTADCVTPVSLVVPDGWTLDGQGHTVTAVDVDDDLLFTGAVITNEAVAKGHMAVKNVHVVGSFTKGGCRGDDVFGVGFNGASGSLVDSTISNIRLAADLRGCVNGRSIDITNDGDDRLTVTVDHVAITDTQKSGIRARGNVNLDLRHSSISGSGLDKDIATNSVQVQSGATALIADNTIEGNDYDGSATDTSATGVLIYGADSVVMTRNVITGTDTDYGVDIENYGDMKVGSVRLTCNLIERDEAVDSTPIGARDDFNTAVYAQAGLQGRIDARGNTVQGFATPFDGVQNEIGGACASDAVSSLHARGTTTSLTATWTAPMPQLFAPVTSYDVTLTPGGAHTTVTGTSATFSGLTAGRTYTVTVVPVNAAGNGASASASAYGTAVSAVPSVTTIVSGKTLTITGKVTDAQTGKAVAGQSITLLSRVQGTTTYVSNGVRATSAANGTFSISVKQGLTKRYYVATGGQDRMGATSPGFTVKARGTATIALNHASVTHGHKVTFSGKVAPKAATVELQRKVGSTWVTVKTVVTTNGAYAFAWTPRSTTDFTWRVRVSGPTFSAGASASKVLKVS